MKNKALEVNGPANIVMLLELYKDEIPVHLAKKLELEAKKTIEYMRQVSVSETKFWHEIILKK